MKIRRFSFAFSFGLLLLSIAVFFIFIVSSEKAITFEDCQKLGLPILKIETDKNKQIKSKEKYVKATYELGDFKGRCKIRGHGNSTWKTTFTQKKPFLLKLDDAAPLLDFPAAKKWILMANACDRSMLRNYYAEYLTHNVWNGMPWCPSSKFITLFLNGKYYGLYGLTEKVEIGENRIEFNDEGFLAEIDSHSGRPYAFLTKSELRFNIRQPESTEENYKKWAAKIEELEDKLYSDDFESENGYKKDFDLKSFVDWYLLAEFSKNYDAKFYNSVFMTYDYEKQKLFMGPAWDHDIGFGNTSKSSTTASMRTGSLLSNSAWIQMFNFFDPEANSTAAKDDEGFLINQSHWYNRMFGDEEFVNAVETRWTETRPQLEQSLVWLKEQGKFLTPAAELNDSIWHLIGSSIWPRAPGYRSRRTYQSEVDYLYDWCESRIKWLDKFFLKENNKISQ